MLQNLLSNIIRPQPTFGQLAERWRVDAERRCKPGYLQDARRLIERELKPLVDRRADRITRSELAALLSKIEKPAMHNKALAHVSSVYGTAIATGYDGENPARGLRKRPLRVQDRVLTRDEIALVWHSCANLNDIGRIARLLLCTGLRRGEIGGLQWSEINLAERQLELPSSRMKNGNPHVVPLTDLAIAQLPPQRDDYPHVFGMKQGRGFSGWSKGKLLIDGPLIGMQPWSFHDLRKTAATYMGELSVPDEVIERILHHAPTGVTRRHYNRSERLAQQREALERWAAELSRIVGAPAGHFHGDNRWKRRENS